ncbi:hypothetical protein J2T08_001034 [Neorhizobium galegae]|uniref:hypothetical protein n=1 Tax=Neorhizobium galegae TaxID=399 RepID=UPI0027851A09|nr:hypothetical protein [Neorhizobium galegae]MDQ0133133.1 hypothetical protein [Neorhizobium galegae]
MKGLIKKALRKAGKYMFPSANHPVRDETSLMLQGKQLAHLKSAFVKDPKGLFDFEFKVFSQWGEDGIIEWLVEQLSPLPQIFIEFGVEDYTESNTRFLLMNRNWRGLVIDGSQDAIAKVRRSELHWRHDLTAHASFITRDNIDRIFEEHGFSGEIGLLSVDIDGNDYWVWEAIKSVNPGIVVCEYCAHFGDVHAVSVPYKEDFTRHAGHYSGQYFGASLKAFISLAHRKGYTFLGTNASGINAFFVRNDLIPRLGDKQPPVKSFPMRASDTRDEQGTLTFIHGPAKAGLIRHLPIIDVETGKQTTLGELGYLYSDEWLKLMRGDLP